MSQVAYPVETDPILLDMFQRYSRTGRAQNVSFRRLVSWLKVGERATHYLHSYPAKLLPQIAHFFLSSSTITPGGSTVLDPFGGTGTVALESILAGQDALYADANPLAVLIARVKTRTVDAIRLTTALSLVEKKYTSSRQQANEWVIPSVVNVDYWYDLPTAQALARLGASINEIEDGHVREFFQVCFSSTCRKVSKADPRLSVPVRRRGNLATPNSHGVWLEFRFVVCSNIARMSEFSALHKSSANARFVGDDARCLRSPSQSSKNGAKRLPRDSVSLIITSPPYAGAQKYIRSSSLSLGWLGFVSKEELKNLDRKSIGREHFLKRETSVCLSTGVPEADRLIRRVFDINPVRSAIVAKYLQDMDFAIAEMVRVLRPGGFAVLVVGNNQVCGMPFKSSDYLAWLAHKHGLKTKLRLIDEIKSRGLMTKRNKTASVITREWVLVFQKPV